MFGSSKPEGLFLIILYLKLYRCRISSAPQNGLSSMAGVPNCITTSDTMAVPQGSVTIAIV